MLTLKMRTFSISPSDDFHRREKCSTWRIGTADLNDATFPPNIRVAALFSTHVPNVGELRVISKVSNSLVVEIPCGSTRPMRQPFLDALEREMNGYGKHTNQSEESRDVDVGKTLLLMFEERRDALLTRLSELRVKAIARGNGKILQMIEEVSEFAETIPDVSRLVFLEQGLDHLNFVIDFEENDGPLN